MPQADGNGKKQSVRSWALRIAVSAVILLLLFWFLPPHQILEAIQQISIGVWALVLCVFLFGHLLGAAKWWLFLRIAADIPFLIAVRAHFAGLLGNIVLPGSTGGDIVRAGLLMRDPNPKAHIAAASIADRLIDTFASLLLAGVGALLAVEHTEQWAKALYYIGLSLVGVVFGLILFPVVMTRLAPIVSFFGVIRSVMVAIGAIGKNVGRLFACFVLSLVVQTVFILSNILLAETTGLHVGTAAWFFAFPLAKLLSAIPISFAGLGVREMGLAAMLSPFGADAIKVVAVSLIWQSVVLAGAILGGAIALGGTPSFWAKLTRPTVLETNE